MSVRLVIGPDGVVRLAEALGHAGRGPAGSNIACAAATVLLRGAWETMALYEGVEVEGSAPMPGSLRFAVGSYPAVAAERLRGIGDFLLTGLSGVEREYPGQFHLVIEDERRT